MCLPCSWLVSENRFPEHFGKEDISEHLAICEIVFIIDTIAKFYKTKTEKNKFHSVS